MADEFSLRVGPTVGERALRELPDAFVGIEFRGVAGESIEVKAGEASLQCSDGFAAVDRAVVPDHDHGAAQMAEEISKEPTDFGVADVLWREQEVQPVASSARTHRDTGDDGDAIAPLPMAKHRRATARRPGAADGRNQEEARLVDEDEVGAQPRGFFLMCGHVSRLHRAMRSSSRSRARRSGFCTLQPSSWSSRPT